MFFKRILAALLFAAVLPTAQAAQPVYTFQVHSPGIQAAAAPASSAYPFSSFTFTPCGATGVSGPTQANCRTSYSGATWAQSDSDFTVAAGIQSWVVPATGSYLITAAGASGGNAVANLGVGAVMSVQVSLTQGAVLQLLVGQPGSANVSTGGGGGSFVVGPGNIALVVAGGGGGFANVTTGRAASANASTSLNGVTSSDGQGAGGTNGGGGKGASAAWGGGGGGFSGTGTDAYYAASYNFAGHGSSFQTGGQGGNSATIAVGGFGGGAGTHGNSGGGGGGGGYSGGGGSGQATGASAGGGGSYYNGTLVSATVSNLGAGYITITKQ